MRDTSGDFNIAHTIDFNNLVGQEHKNLPAENLNRLELNRKTNIVSTASRIEVETSYNSVTLEPKADIVRYYSPLSNRLTTTILKPITREGLNPDLDITVNDIDIDN